jgi:CubicO group peptidase (beta-lactamase class C family)
VKLRLAAFTTVLFAVPSFSMAAAAASPALDRSDVETFVDGIMEDQLRTANIAGAVVAIVQGEGVVLAKGYGYSDIERQRPVDAENTLFRPGSVSKLFTFTAVMQLVEQGKLDLDADVNRYLKSFKIPATFPQPVTLRDLLAHTAGFENINVQLFAPDAAHLVPLREALQKNMPRRVRPPGLYSSYSNYGAALSGLIVEEVSGQGFDDYVEEHIFKPLGMAHTTFREPLPADLATLMSKGYAFGGGAFVPLDFEYLHNAAPAGSASATALDMAKFMIAHLHNGQYGAVRILKEDTAREMHGRLFANDSRLPGMAYGFNEGSINGRRFLGHRGDTQWFHSDLHLILDQGVGIFVSYNTPLPGNQREALLQAFMDRYYPAAAAPAPVAPADFARRASRYVGAYQNMSRGYTTFEKFDEFLGGSRRTISLTPQNTLFLDAGYASMQFAEIAPDRFRQINGQEEMVFRQEPGGRLVFFLSSWPATTVEKLSRWTNPTLQRCLMSLAMLIFMAFIARLVHTGRETGTYPPSQRWARRCIAAASVLNLIFFLTFVPLYVLDQGSTYLNGLSATLRLLLLIPVVTAAPAVCGAAIVFLAWLRGRWRLRLRIEYTLAAAAALQMIWFTLHYNIFGIRM